MTVSSEEITAVFGPVDEIMRAEILASGATVQELSEAWAWVNNDEALIGEGRPLPKGRVADLIDLLIADQEPEE